MSQPEPPVDPPSGKQVDPIEKLHESLLDTEHWLGQIHRSLIGDDARQMLELDIEGIRQKLKVIE